MEKWRKEEEARIRKVASGTATDAEKRPKLKPLIRMLDEDADNMLKLSAALKIILSRTIILSEQDRAKELLYDYLETFLKVCLTFLSSYSTDSDDSYIPMMSNPITTGLLISLNRSLILVQFTTGGPFFSNALIKYSRATALIITREVISRFLSCVRSTETLA